MQETYAESRAIDRFDQPVHEIDAGSPTPSSLYVMVLPLAAFANPTLAAPVPPPYTAIQYDPAARDVEVIGSLVHPVVAKPVRVVAASCVPGQFDSYQ